jgi:hypothetical protein
MTGLFGRWLWLPRLVSVRDYLPWFETYGAYCITEDLGKLSGLALGSAATCNPSLTAY